MLALPNGDLERPTIVFHNLRIIVEDVGITPGNKGGDSDFAFCHTAQSRRVLVQSFNGLLGSGTEQRSGRVQQSPHEILQDRTCETEQAPLVFVRRRFYSLLPLEFSTKTVPGASTRHHRLNGPRGSELLHILLHCLVALQIRRWRWRRMGF